jgi:two-component system, cell cycle sensor histidine kinase and response regulator CckA
VEGTKETLGSETVLAQTAGLVCQALESSGLGAAVVRLNGECVAANRRLATHGRPGAQAADLEGASLLGGDDGTLAAAVARVSLGDPVTVNLDWFPFDPARRGSFRVHLAPFRLGAMVCGATLTVETPGATPAASSSMQAAELRFRALVESAGDGIGVHRGGILLYVNPAVVHLLGYESAADVIGRPIMDFVHPDHHDRVRSHLAGLAHSGEAPTRQETFVRKDGSSVEVEVSASRAELEDGVTTFVFFRDVTRRCRMQADLDRAGRMESLSRFSGSVAHDFNNVLAGIQGNIAIARLQLDQRSALVAALDNAQREVQRAAELTRQLLTFSRGADVEVTSLDPNHAVQEALGQFVRQYPDVRGLRADLGSEVGAVRMGDTQLQQILQTLLSNAREAVRGEGQILVRTEARLIQPRDAWPPERAGQWVVIAVEDTGVGMDAATVARIFEPFFSTRRVGQGSGLGLATAYGLARQAGGWIDVESEYGRGTQVSLFLPRYDEPAVPGEPEHRSTAPSGGETVLVCDDEARLAMLTAGLLDQYGYGAVTVSSCEEAIAVLDRKEPRCDVVLLDVNLPDGSASAVLDQMRARGYAQPVILTSGYAAEDVPRELMTDARVAGYLAKPYSVDRLVETVRLALDGAPARP